MLKVLSESKSGYNYKNFIIQNSTKDGIWYVITSSGEVVGSFSTDTDAEEFVDSIDSEDLITGTIPKDTDNNLPVKSTTLKNLDKKYRGCTGIAYILSSSYKDKYATVQGVGGISDPDLMIFKTAELARQSRLRRRSNFGIQEVKLVNGSIKF